MRSPTRKQKPRKTEPMMWPAPRNGWIANRNLSQPGARNPDGSKVSGATILDNFFPTATGARLRRGSEQYADITGTEVVSLFSYIDGTNEKLFAADASKISDITGVPSDAITGQTSGDWVSNQFSTSGGVFLRIVNGSDTPLVYDGASFSTSPALTFAAPDGAKTPDVLNYVWSYRERLFFLENDSLDAWYLPVGTIGGELTKLPLGGVFERGGSLLFGSFWSNDSGASGGLSEQIVFVTTEGEVAVYQGGNPSDASDWGKVGVYRIGRPLGKRSWFRAGGDVVIATSVGLVSLASAVSKDFAALAPTAVSYPIEDAWNYAVDTRPELDWWCEVWANQQLAIVAVPFSQSLEIESFVVNVRTGAWCRFTGWDVRSVHVFRDRMFFGTASGIVMEAMAGGTDDAAPYTGILAPLFEDMGTPTQKKITRLSRAVYRAPVNAGANISMFVDFIVSTPAAPSASTIPSTSIWGSGVWGTAVWGEGAEPLTIQEWQSVFGTGAALAPCFQVTSGDTVPLDVEFVRFDTTHVTGDVVTG